MTTNRKEYMQEYVLKNRAKILAIKNKYNASHRKENNERGASYRRRVPRGSPKEKTWNGEVHTCCNSKRKYMHRMNCCLNSDDLSDLKDIHS